MTTLVRFWRWLRGLFGRKSFLVTCAPSGLTGDIYVNGRKIGTITGCDTRIGTVTYEGISVTNTTGGVYYAIPPQENAK